MISVGHQLGGYSIVRRIGGGGMGEVFLAEHRRVARRAAVKALIPELSAKESVLEIFFKEARNTSLIRHPGIVEILDCDVHDGQAFIIMEFLEGESLGTYLRRSEALRSDLAFLLGLTAETASAVAAAHAAGIMHRDLKPENIYLHLAGATDPTVSVKVTDFGISKLSRNDGGPSHTRSGVLLGSPAYMSPEQCRGVGRPDARSDVYSLGCVLYEGLCGRPPFGARSLGDLILAHATEAPRAPGKLVDGLPARLNSLVLKMLAKAPEERPQTMGQVIETLRDCARSMGIDFEGPLQPIDPVARPTDHPAAPLVPEPARTAMAAAAPSRSAPPSPASGAVAAADALNAARPIAAWGPPGPPSPPGAAAGGGPRRPLPATFPMPTPVPGESARAPAPAADVLGPNVGRAGLPIGGTMILDEPTGTEAFERLRAVGPSPSRAALVGGTLMLERTDPLSRERERPSAENETPAGLPGGTMILTAADGGSDDAGDSDAGPPAHRGDGMDSPAWHDRQPRHDRRHLRHQMPAQPSVSPRAAGVEDVDVRRRRGRGPWYASVWTERPRLLLIVGACVVLVAVVLSALLSSTRQFPQSDVTPPVVARSAIEAALPSVKSIPRPPGPSGADALRPAAASATGTTPAALPSPEPLGRTTTVRIDIEGVPPGTTVSVDGHPAVLPLRVPRGRDTHRIALRAPGGVERAIEVDGTRDRTIEMVVEPATRGQAPHHATTDRLPMAPAPRPSSTGARDTDAKARSGAKTSQAITDI